MIGATRMLHCRTEDVERFSRWSLEEFASEMERHLAWRDSHPPEQILDVGFNDIVGNGMPVARRIYDFLGTVWSPATENEVRLWLADNETQKDKLEYSPAGLGFTEAECRRRFADYYQRYSRFF